MAASPFFHFILLLVLTLSAGRALADCYWPDGTQTLEHNSCADASGSYIGLCCHGYDRCLNNTLCMRQHTAPDNDNLYYRGSCNDKDWNNPYCPSFCPDGHEVTVHECSDPADQWYCEGVKSVNCSRKWNVFSLSGDFEVYDTVNSPRRGPSSSKHISASSGKQSNTAATSTSSPPSSSVPGRSSASQKSASAAPSTSSHPSGPPGTVTNFKTVSLPESSPGLPSASLITTLGPGGSSAPLNTSSSNPPSQSNSVTPLVVGISIGGVAIIAAVIMGILLLRKRRRDTPIRAETPPPDGPSDGPMDFNFNFPTTDGRQPTLPQVFDPSPVGQHFMVEPPLEDNKTIYHAISEDRIGEKATHCAELPG